MGSFHSASCQSYPKGDISLQRLIWSIGEVNQLQTEMVPEGKAEEKPIAILFCDLRNFTSLSSTNENFDMAYLLNRFYTTLGDPILMNNGVIYQYIGDEIVGVFGTTGGTKEKNCLDAIRAALGMQYALDRLNKVELRDLNIKLESGIGINFGQAYVGHLGHPTHRVFSVVGDPVNVASRIQGETKLTKTKILISHSIFENIEKKYLKIGGVFDSSLKGKKKKFKLYELLGFSDMDMQLELQASLYYLLKDEDLFASLFYSKVFEKAPHIKSLFKKNMIDQGRLLTHMLGGVVYALSRPEFLKTGLKKLGQNHINYGVKAEHYPIVKEAILETIEETLGEDKTEKSIAAWNSALDFILDAMQHSQ